MLAAALAHGATAAFGSDVRLEFLRGARGNLEALGYGVALEAAEDEEGEQAVAAPDETDETLDGRGDETDETRTRPGSRAEDARRLVSRARQSVEHDASALASWSSSYDELQDLRLVGADSLAKRVLRDCELFQHASVVTASCAPKISQDLPRSP
jgi:hypothetical protein